VCVTTNACPSAGDSDLTTISQDNDGGSEHSSSVTLVCGKAPDMDVAPAPCSDFSDTLITTCPAPMLNGAAWGGDYVQAYTSKQTDHIFAGGGSSQGKACASVAWAAPNSVTGVLPVTLPTCYFTDLVPTGTPDPDHTSDVAFAIDDQKAPSPCAQGPTGGKGWLDGDCTTLTATIGQSNPGKGKGSDCLAGLVGSVVYVPLYDSSDGTGSGGHYHIIGIAGFKLDGISGPSLGNHGNTDSPGCPKDGYNVGPGGKNNGNACLWGYFVSAIVPFGTIGGGGMHTGLNVIQTIG
jgi:hypothetical protein